MINHCPFLSSHPSTDEEPVRYKVVLGTHWSLNLGIPVLVVLSFLNLVVSLVK